MVSLAILALVLALIVQSERAAEREKRLRTAMIQAKSKAYADEKMRCFLGDLGIVILKDVTKIGLLRIGDPKEPVQSHARTPTGKVFGKPFAGRIGRIFLDTKNYRFLDASDMPDPEIGLRISRGEDSIDLLFSLKPSGPSGGHQDVWAFVHAERGDVFKVNGSQTCFYDPGLEKLLEELKAIEVNVFESDNSGN